MTQLPDAGSEAPEPPPAFNPDAGPEPASKPLMDAKTGFAFKELEKKLFASEQEVKTLKARLRKIEEATGYSVPTTPSKATTPSKPATPSKSPAQVRVDRMLDENNPKSPQSEGLRERLKQMAETGGFDSSDDEEEQKKAAASSQPAEFAGGQEAGSWMPGTPDNHLSGKGQEATRVDVPTLFDSTASRSSSFAQPVGEQDNGAGVGLGFGGVRIPSSFTEEGDRSIGLIPPGENEARSPIVGTRGSSFLWAPVEGSSGLGGAIRQSAVK